LKTTRGEARGGTRGAELGVEDVRDREEEAARGGALLQATEAVADGGRGRERARGRSWRREDGEGPAATGDD
jgi:hypothetical protein